VGGSGGERAFAIAVDPDGDAYVGGATVSTDFPVTSGAVQSTLLSGSWNGFLAALSPDGSSLIYGTYLGGSGAASGDYVSGLALDSHENLYVAGQTDSADFPATQGALQTGLNGSTDAFVTELTGIVTTPQISAISPASGGIGATITLTGSHFGSVQTGSAVKFNGVAARVTTWSDGSIAVRVPGGLNPGVATVNVSVNQMASNGVQFTVTQPLFITPNKAALLVGQSRPMQLLNENGAVISNPSWAFDDGSIAEIVPPVNPGDPTLLQGDAIGTTTLVASYGNRKGTASVSVFPAGTSFPVGTVQWAVPSLGTFGISNSVQALRVDDNTPDLFVEDDGALGGSGAIRALTADGQQKWIWPSTPQDKFPLLLAADNSGGAVYFASQNIPNQFASYCYFGRVDENGDESWQYQETNCFEDYAIGPDGTIYLMEDEFRNSGTNVLMALDATTGQVKFTIPLPGFDQKTINNVTYMPPPGNPDGSLPYCTPGNTIGPIISSNASSFEHGSMSVSSDGTLYIPLTGASIIYDGEPCDSSPDPNNPGYTHLVDFSTGSGSSSGTATLYLMAVNSNGTYSIQSVDSSSGSSSGWSNASAGQFSIFAQRPAPDGQGGAFLPTGQTVYHVSTSGTSKFSVPITLSSNDLLLGEDGTAYLSGTSQNSSTADTLLALDTGSGAIKWTASPGQNPLPGTILSDGSAAFQYMQSDFSLHLAIADPSGRVSPLFVNSGNGSDVGPVIHLRYGARGASYWNLGAWYTYQNDGGLGFVTGNNMFVAASQRSVNGGSEKKDNSPHLPGIVSYLPSQIESNPNATNTTLGFPCFQDASSQTSLKNALRNYVLNPCSTNPSLLAPNQVAQSYRLRSDAIAQTFRKDLNESLDALVFIGHSSVINLNQPSEFSNGIEFFYPVYPGKNPGDESSWDILYNVPGDPRYTEILAPECAAPDNFCVNSSSTYLNKLLPFEKDSSTVAGLGSIWNYYNHGATLDITPGEPGPLHAPLLLVNRISQQAKILFFGACALSPKLAQPNEVPVFLQMWDISDARFGTPETRDRAMIIPDGSSIASFDPNTTDLAYAAAMWNKILFDLVKLKMKVGDAVADANNTITPTWKNVPGGSVQPTFMVLGNSSVRLR